MLGNTSTGSSRPFIARALAAAALVTIYFCNMVGMAGVLMLSSASTSIAQQRGYQRGRRTSRGSQSSSASTTTTKSSKRHGYRGNSNMSSSMSTRGTGTWLGNSGSGGGSSSSSGGMRGSSSSSGGAMSSGPGRGDFDSRGAGNSNSRDNANVERTSATMDDAKRAEAIAWCTRTYQSFDRETMTYLDFYGRRKSCP